MGYEPLNHTDDFLNQLADALLAPLKEEVSTQKKYLRDSEKTFQSYYQRIIRIESKNGISKYINETNWLKGELYSILETEYPSKDLKSITHFFSDYYSLIDKKLADTPEYVKEIQAEDRFKITKKESVQVQLLKSAKIVGFKLAKLPRSTANLFRKEKLPLSYWSHKIPLRAMEQDFFSNRIIFKSLKHFEQLQRLKCDARNIKWEINKDINIEVASLLDKEELNADILVKHLQTLSEKDRIQEIIDNFNRILKVWRAEIQEDLKNLVLEFEETRKLVDTIELNINNFSTNVIQDDHRKNEAKFQAIFNGWRNTEFAQIDDFQVDLELYQIKYRGLMQYHLLQNSCQTRIEKTVVENINGISQEISSIASQIAKMKNCEELKNLMIAEKIKIHHQLKMKSIPLAINTLYNQNFPQLIERLEGKIQEQLNQMKNRRIIYSKETYEAPIPKSNLSHFNPKELVQVDLIKEFNSEVKKIKTEVNNTLQQTEIGLNDLIEIIDYNLDAAINSISDEINCEEVKTIALEGLERSTSKTVTIQSNIESISTLIENNLKKEIEILNIKLIRLTKNENITNLRIALAKAKAVEKTKEYRRQLIQKITNFLPIALRFGRAKLSQVLAIFNLIKERLGLADRPVTLTNELSDFLSDTEIAIQKLPFVYRRLYDIKPLDEEAFFEGRITELNLLEKAYVSWSDGKNSSAVIVGEKGSGSSSLVNHFVRKNSGTSILRSKLLRNYSSEQDFIDFFQDLLNQDDLTSLQSIVEHLSNETKRVIIIEDIQHFFMKKIHGFEAINLLFELISRTAENIFWLLETTAFAWTYLQKTISIERYIKHKIVLSPLTNKQIVNLIMKRHRVSGYNLEFENKGLSRIERRRLLGKSPKEIQEIWKKQFFQELNQFAQSNISLALLYWLRSTSSFNENTVVIGKIKYINFDFLNALEKDSIFTLHTLLLHDSITVNDHALIFHQSEKQSRMTLMVLEDGGILKLKDGRYFINQLLYRQVVNVLRNKNLVH